ncbi:MAG: hypothetical protein Q9162_001944 [Coniocarpon cinnabarinum]
MLEIVNKISDVRAKDISSDKDKDNDDTDNSSNVSSSEYWQALLGEGRASYPLKYKSYKGRQLDQPQHSALSKRLSNWWMIEEIAGYLNRRDWPSFARSCRGHYSIAQVFLWSKPVLHITEAQLFLTGVFRQPLVSNQDLIAQGGPLQSDERSEKVSCVTLDFTNLGLELADVCEDAASRIRNFCPNTCIEVLVTENSGLSLCWRVN